MTDAAFVINFARAMSHLKAAKDANGPCTLDAEEVVAVCDVLQVLAQKTREKTNDR